MPATSEPHSPAEVVQRVTTPRGELVLRRQGEHYEIISNGIFLMDTREGASARLLVRAAVIDRAGPLRVLVCGLGVGFSLMEALQHPEVGHVTVVELEPAVIAWHDTHLAAVSGGAVRDPRVTVVCADLLYWLRRNAERYDAICVDIDNGPDWTVSEANAALYLDEGLELLASRLDRGGVLAVWSANAAVDFEARCRRRFSDVRVLPVEVPRGEPDLVYVAHTD